MRRVAIVGAGMTQFAEHFDLGVKDLVPMAVSEMSASVDKGLDRSRIEAAWIGELTSTDDRSRPTRRHLGPVQHTGDQGRERLCHRAGCPSQRSVRRGFGLRRCGSGCGC